MKHCETNRPRPGVMSIIRLTMVVTMVTQPISIIKLLYPKMGILVG